MGSGLCLACECLCHYVAVPRKDPKTHLEVPRTFVAWKQGSSVEHGSNVRDTVNTTEPSGIQLAKLGDFPSLRCALGYLGVLFV